MPRKSLILSISKQTILCLAMILAPAHYLLAQVSNGEGSAPRANSVTRYFQDPSPIFSKILYTTPGNHPDRFEAEGTADELSTSSDSLYGTRRSSIRLNLATGEMRTSFEVSPSEDSTAFTLPPPDQGGDYFSYLDLLDQMKATLQRLPLPEALDFIRRAKDKISNIENVDSLKIIDWSRENFLGAALKLKIDYRTSGDRDLVLSICDQFHCYSQERIPLPEHDRTIRLSISIPKSIQDCASARIVIKSVPRLASVEKVLAETAQKFRVEAYETVGVYLPTANIRGDLSSAYVSYRTLETATVILRIFDAENKIVGESKAQIPSTSSGSIMDGLHLKFTISQDASVGIGVAVVRLLKGSDVWDDFNLESTTSISIH